MALSMQPIRVENQFGGPQTIALYHEYYCAGGGECQCTREAYQHVVHDPVSGGRKLVESQRVLPREIRLDPGEKAVLHPAFLGIPGIRAAVESGRFRVASATAEEVETLRRPLSRPAVKG